MDQTIYGIFFAGLDPFDRYDRGYLKVEQNSILMKGWLFTAGLEFQVIKLKIPGHKKTQSVEVKFRHKV